MVNNEYSRGWQMSTPFYLIPKNLIMTESSYQYIRQLLTKESDQIKATFLHLRHQQTLPLEHRVSEVIEEEIQALEDTWKLAQDALGELIRIQPTPKPKFN